MGKNIELISRFLYPSNTCKTFIMNGSDFNFNQTLEISFIIYSTASIAALILSTFGLTVNLFLLYVLFTDRRFHKTTYYLIFVSIISDTISTFATISGYIQIIRYELDFEGGTLMCRAVMFTMFTSYGISMMTLCLIGIDRYFIIVRPLHTFYRIYKNRILVICEALIWTVSFCSSAPLLKFMGVHKIDPLLCEFIIITTPISVYIIIFVPIQFIIPSLTIGLIYWRIILHQKNYTQPGESIPNRTAQLNFRKRRFIKMLISISLSYILATWPFFATIFGFAITQKSVLQVRSENLMIFLFIFFSLSATTSITILNPFLYLKFDVNIRKRSLLVLKCINRLTNPPTTTTSVIVLNKEALARSQGR